MTSPGLLLLIAIVFALVGFIAGVAAVMLIGGRDKAGQAGKEISPDHEELLTLLRERSGGGIALAIGSKLVRSADELTEKQRRAVHVLNRDWASWIGDQGLEPASAGQPAPAGVPVPASAPPAAETTLPPAASLPKPLLLEERPEAPETSIVGQINRVLREKVAGTRYENGYLLLAEDPLKGGVTVWLGAQQFPDLDSVPDETARAAIRSAVKEWEQRADSLNLRPTAG